MQQAIINCGLSMQKVLKACEEVFPEEGCYLSTSFMAARNCPEDFKASGYGYCVPSCPVGYEHLEKNDFFCGKSLKSNFSSDY